MPRSMLDELTRAAESRHPWTRGHAERVADLAVEVARALEWDAAQIAAVRIGSLLHDVGKLMVAPEILGKPGPLTAAELATVRMHPLLGVRLLARRTDADAAIPCVLHHHERWDGYGYPHGLAAAHVSVEARLVGLADAFDAMTSMRPYRAPLSHRAALAEIVRCAGTQFDPVLANVAVDVWRDAQLVAV